MRAAPMADVDRFSHSAGYTPSRHPGACLHRECGHRRFRTNLAFGSVLTGVGADWLYYSPTVFILFHRGPTAGIDAITDEEWQRTIDINLTGQYRFAHHVVPLLKASPNAHLIHIASVAGRLGYA